MAKKSKMNVSSPILYIILGALLIIFKAQMLNWAMTIAGIFFTVTGIIDIVKGRTSSGAVNLVIGILILVLGNTLLGVVLIVLGILIAVKGLIDLLEVFKRKNRNALQVVFPVISIIVGIALAFGNLLGDLIVIIGVLLVIDGVLGLLGAKK